MKTKTIMHTIVETPEFIKQAKLCMSSESREEFIDFIAEHPLKGDLIPGTGGVRKVRWGSVPDKGKSGGSRIIYYYHDLNIPIFLFTAYGKGSKDNLTKEECNILKKITSQIVEAYKRKSS